MPPLDFPIVLVSYLLFLFTAFEIGFMCLHFKRGNSRFFSIPLFIRLPIYTALGLSILTLIYLITGIVIVNWLTSLLIILSINVSFFVFLAKYNSKILSMESFVLKKEEIAHLIPFIVTLVYFMLVTYIFAWPPPGDLIRHGASVSLIIYNQKIPTDMYPFNPDLPFFYPFGFHIVSAFWSLLLNIYPGEAMLLLGGVVLVLIGPLLYSMTYMLTKSRVLSLLPFFTSFIVYWGTGRNLERWLVGYYFNGPYPCLYGFMLSILSLSFVLLWYTTKLDRFFFTAFLVIITNFIVYSPFALLNALYLVIVFFYLRDRSYSVTSWIRKNLLSIILCFSLGIVVLGYYTIASGSFQIYIEHISSEGGVGPGYVYPLSLLYTDMVGIAMVPALVISVLSVKIDGSRIMRAIYVYYFFITLISLLSLSSFLYKFLQFLLPNRVMIISALLSWLVIARVGYLASQRLDSSNVSNVITKVRMDKGTKLKVGLVLGIVLAIGPSLVFQFSLLAANNYAWFPRSSYFRNDMQALEWINIRVPSEDLILNDYSWSGLYLESVSIKNVTCFYLLSPSLQQRVKDIYRIWFTPSNETLVRDLLVKYDVKYILVTSEPFFQNYTYIGGTDRYVEKLFEPSEYNEVFGNYTFLEQVFRIGDSSVYSVNI